MKKLVLSISMFLIAATTFAQSEVVTDSIPPISLDGYKNFNGFMLDMGSMIMAPPPLIAPQLYYQPYNNNAIANYNEIFRPNMNIIYDRGSYNHIISIITVVSCPMLFGGYYQYVPDRPVSYNSPPEPPSLSGPFHHPLPSGSQR